MTISDGSARPVSAEFLKKLPTRTRNKVRALHYVHFDNKFYCLDFKILADTVKALNDLALKALDDLEPAEVLPGTNEGEWLQTKNLKFVRLLFPPYLTASGNRLAVVILEGDFNVLG